jgi:hypothetical protein
MKNTRKSRDETDGVRFCTLFKNAYPFCRRRHFLASSDGEIVCRERLGGVLRHYYREVA